MKHEAKCIAIGVSAELLLCFFVNTSVKVFSVLLCLILSVLLLTVLKSKVDMVASKLIILVLISMVVAGLYQMVYTSLFVDSLNKFDGKSVTLKGRVIDYTDSDSSRVTVKGHIDGVKCKVTFFSTGFTADWGDEIYVNATASSFKDASMRNYYYSNGNYIELQSAEVIDSSPAKGAWKIYYYLKTYSSYISTRIRSLTGIEEGEFLPAMLCGRQPTLSKDMRKAMNRAGVGHMLAVSGIHVSLLVVFISTIMDFFKVHRYITVSISAIVLSAFVLFSGLKISAIRALIMTMIFLLSKVFIREYSASASLSVCVILMLIYDPYTICDASFLLSVSGVFGVAIVAREAINVFEIKNKIAATLVTGLCASICVLPFSVFFFDEISLVSFITNLFMVPICSIALCLCIIFAIFGGTVYLSFAVMFAGKIASFIIWACRMISSLKFTYLPIKSECISYAVLFMAIFSVFLFVFTRSKKIAISACGIFYCITILLITGLIRYDAAFPSVTVSTKNGEFLCVISQNGESIAIDSNCGFSDTCKDILNYNGIDNLRYVFILKNGVSGYSSYYRSDPEPDTIVFSDTRLVAQTDRINEISDVEHIKLSDTSVDIYSDGRVVITVNGKTLTIGKTYEDGNMSITILDGVTVIRNGENTELYDDVFEMTFRLT